MKFSLITVCYNSANTIEDTFRSVLKQTYQNFEYIVIDGCSTDKTVELIKKYASIFHGKMRWISEKDNGIYDAMNKGIKMASGDIIGIINSDDVFARSDALSMIASAFLHHTCDAVYGDLEVRDENLKETHRLFIAKKGNYRLGWYPPHPTLYLKKSVYETFGFSDLKYRIAADYDFMIRIMKAKISFYYIPKVLVYMRSGGISTNGLSGYFANFKESCAVLRHNKVPLAFLVNLLRVFATFKQMFFKI